jgi:cytochrome c nitrite reductase small subunit
MRMKIKGFYLYLWVSILLILFISASYGMFEYTKRSSFCRGCHEMDRAHDTWVSSKHGPILGEIDSCIVCHAEEGAWGYIKAKLSGIRSVYYHITGQIAGRYFEIAKGSKPVYCLKTGCHTMKNLDKGLKISVNHDLHSQKGFKCVSCHDRIAHGLDENLRSSPGMQETCFICHDHNTSATHDDCGKCHIYQKDMLNGIGGAGIENIPSPHGEDFSCKECHTQSCAPDLLACSSCHDQSLLGTINERQEKVSVRLEELRASLKQLERILKGYNESATGLKNRIKEIILYRKVKIPYELAKSNYEFVSNDLSRGVHNFEYTWKMLTISNEEVNKAIILFKTTINP